MSRNSFFSNAPHNNSIQDSSKTISEHVRKSQQNTSVSQIPALATSTQKSKRIAYTIKIDPEIRKSIKDWAQQHDVTISSVIETLARLHLHDLSADDIHL